MGLIVSVCTTHTHPQQSAGTECKVAYFLRVLPDTWLHWVALIFYAHKLSTFILNTTIFRILVLGTFSGYIYSEFPVTHRCCVRPSQFVCFVRDEKETKCSQSKTDLATYLFLDIMKYSDSYSFDPNFFSPIVAVHKRGTVNSGVKGQSGREKE